MKTGGGHECRELRYDAVDLDIVLRQPSTALWFVKKADQNDESSAERFGLSCQKQGIRSRRTFSEKVGITRALELAARTAAETMAKIFIVFKRNWGRTNMCPKCLEKIPVLLTTTLAQSQNQAVNFYYHQIPIQRPYYPIICFIINKNCDLKFVDDLISSDHRNPAPPPLCSRLQPSPLHQALKTNHRNCFYLRSPPPPKSRLRQWLRRTNDNPLSPSIKKLSLLLQHKRHHKIHSPLVLRYEH